MSGVHAMNLLSAALDNQNDLNPTGSKLLLDLRARWIPVEVRRDMDRKNVRHIAALVLKGEPWLVAYGEIHEEHRIAVAYLLMEIVRQHALRHLSTHDEIKRFANHRINQRVATFFNEIDISHAFLAIRNFKADSDAMQTIEVFTRFSWR